MLRTRRVKDIVVHAADQETAEAHVKRLYPGWKTRHCQEVMGTPVHFVVANWVTD